MKYTIQVASYMYITLLYGYLVAYTRHSLQPRPSKQFFFFPWLKKKLHGSPGFEATPD